MRRVAAAVLLVIASAAVPAAASQTAAKKPAASVPVKVERVAEGLQHPWAFAFLPDARILVTERPGRMRIVAKDGSVSEPVTGLPPIVARSQGGLLDVVLDPKFSDNQTIYFSFSEPREGGGDGTSVAKARLAAPPNAVPSVQNVEIIFRQTPPADGNMHYGSRLAFAPDGNLFVTLGERFRHRDRAQSLDNHYGKVVRITPAGAPPPDNPFVGRSGTLPEIWSYGHRNPQSAAVHPTTGRLWIVDHGPRGGDEINIPQAGKNYGWPEINYGREYSGASIGVGTAKSGMEQPLYYWDPSIAPSGMAFYTSDRIPEWKGSLLVGALVQRHLARLVLDGENVVAEERLLTDLNERIRDVRQGPDGYVYVATDSPNGRILRVVPASR